MLVKIQNSGISVKSKNTSSSRSLLSYLEHEDAERRANGLLDFPFFMPDGTPVSKEEIADKLDRNHGQLSLLDDKFYHLLIAPDPTKEVPEMGETEEEIYNNAVILARAASDAYAKGFHREGVEGYKDLYIWWKIHFTRDGKPGVHLHGVVGRKARNGKKLSPLTNHRDTKKGPVLGGFDREAFVGECEKIFDELMHIDRSVVDTYEFKWAMKKGTPADKAAQAERLAREEMASLKTDISSARENRRKQQKNNEDIEEIVALLHQKDAKLPKPVQNISEVVDKVALGKDLMQTFARSQDKLSLELNLASLGLVAKPKTNKNRDEGVQDMELTYRGHSFMASEILVAHQFSILLDQWTRITGQESALRIRQRRERQEAERKLKLTQEHERQQSHSRGIRMHL